MSRNSLVVSFGLFINILIREPACIDIFGGRGVWYKFLSIMHIRTFVIAEITEITLIQYLPGHKTLTGLV